MTVSLCISNKTLQLASFQCGCSLEIDADFPGISVEVIDGQIDWETGSHPQIESDISVPSGFGKFWTEITCDESLKRDGGYGVGMAAEEEKHQWINGLTLSWRYWKEEAVIGGKDDHDTAARQSSNDSSFSGEKNGAWQNFGRQDSDRGDPQLYSFEDYVTPINSWEPLNCRMAGISDSSYGQASGDSDVAMWSKTCSDQLTAIQGRTPSSTAASLERLSLNHKMTYFFSNHEVNESPSLRRSYEDICRTTPPISPIANPSSAHLGSFADWDAADADADAGLANPLYYTTPPLSQIPRRCAIKHKRKLIRSNTLLSSNSIQKLTEKVADSTTAAADDCKATEKYNSNGSLVTHLVGHDWLNAVGIHGSLSLPNRLNEESNGLTTVHFRSAAVPPDQPTNVTLSITSGTSLLVSFFLPNGQTTANIVGYIVEWSRFPGFNPLTGSHMVTDAFETSFEISDLETGMNYYVQVKAMNTCGQGPAMVANPSCAVPSDWRDIDRSSNRTDGKRQILDDMYNTIRNTLNSSLHPGSQLTKASPAWKKKVRYTFMNLFSSAPKFYRSTKSGIYLAIVIHHNGRILVTANDEIIPVAEIDSDYMPTTATLNADLQWLTKITCNWHNVKMLRQLLQKISVCDVSSLQFRRNFLQTVLQLQTALGIKDLGQLYHQSTRDATSGAFVLTTVCCLNDSKQVNTTHVKWMSLGKLLKRSSDGNFHQNPLTDPLEENQPLSLHATLLEASTEMIDYNTGSNVRLSRGLYLGYLKLGSSLDQILVMTVQNQPNNLPNVKIRENSHVSREEWSLIREFDERQSPTRRRLTESQETFSRHLKNACSRLFKKLGMEGNAEAMDHRLYDFEVLEFSRDVSMIVLLPPPDQICTGPGQKDETPSTCINLPVHMFEMLHMRLYHLDLMRRYSQLSSFLEIEFRIAQQELRMGISEGDVELAQRRVNILTDVQQRLEDSWREMRWIVDLAMRARDKKVNCGIHVDHLFTENIRI